MKTVYSG